MIVRVRHRRMLPEAMTWQELEEDLREGLLPLDFEIEQQGHWIPGRDHPRIAEIFRTPRLRLRQHRERRWARWRAGSALLALVLLPQLAERAPLASTDDWVYQRSWWWVFAEGVHPLASLRSVAELFDRPFAAWGFLLLAAWLLLRSAGWSAPALVLLAALLLDHCLAWVQGSLWLAPPLSICCTALGALLILGPWTARRLPLTAASRTRSELILLGVLLPIALVSLEVHHPLPTGMHFQDHRSWSLVGILPGLVLGLYLARWMPRGRAARSLVLDALPVVGLAALLCSLLWLRIDRATRSPLTELETSRIDALGLQLTVPTPLRQYGSRPLRGHSWTLRGWLNVDLMWPQADFGEDRRWFSGRQGQTWTELRSAKASPGDRFTRTLDLIHERDGYRVAHAIERLIQAEGHGWRVRCDLPDGQLGGRREALCWELLASAEPGTPDKAALLSARMEAQYPDPIATMANVALLKEQGEHYMAGRLLERLPLPGDTAYWGGAEAQRWQAAHLRLTEDPSCWYGKVERIRLARQIVATAPLEEAELIGRAAEQLAYLNDCETLEPLLGDRLRPLELARLCAPGRRRRCPEGG